MRPEWKIVETKIAYGVKELQDYVNYHKLNKKGTQFDITEICEDPKYLGDGKGQIKNLYRIEIMAKVDSPGEVRDKELKKVREPKVIKGHPRICKPEDIDPYGDDAVNDGTIQTDKTGVGPSEHAKEQRKDRLEGAEPLKVCPMCKLSYVGLIVEELCDSCYSGLTSRPLCSPIPRGPAVPNNTPEEIIENSSYTLKDCPKCKKQYLGNLCKSCFDKGLEE